jgi:hypothetical protein
LPDANAGDYTPESARYDSSEALEAISREPRCRATAEVDGNFTIRGVSNPEKLTLVVSRKEGHLAAIEGKMIFNRKNYGMNKGIPFVKIGDHVEVNFHLIVRHSGGPPLALSGRNSS